jgi:hypothetical protein
LTQTRTYTPLGTASGKKYYRVNPLYEDTATTKDTLESGQRQFENKENTHTGNMERKPTITEQIF